MTDLRDRLHRASGITGDESVDHRAVADRTRRIVRRRRVLHGATAAVAVSLIGVGAFQVVQGNRFGLSEDVAIQPPPPPQPAVLHIDPEQPVVGDEVFFELENVSDRPISVDPSWDLLLPSGEGMASAAKCCVETIDPSERAEVGPEGMPFEVEGTYELSLTFAVAGGSRETVAYEFTVLPTRDETEGSFAVVRLSPEQPMQGDTVTVLLENVSHGPIHYDRVYRLERRVGGEWEDVGGGEPFDGPYLATLAPSRTEPAWTLTTEGGDGLPRGEYLFSATVSARDEEVRLMRMFEVVARRPIVIATPARGDQVPAPEVLVEGTTMMFEGSVGIRILDEKGAVIGAASTTVVCGTRCRDDTEEFQPFEQPRFSATVSFSVEREQQGAIQVFEEAAESAEPQHGRLNAVEIPVTLLPD